MPSRKEYSGKDQIVAIDGIPLVDLSDADDAIVAEITEDRFGEPSMDLYGDGRHVENRNGSGTVTLRIKNTSIVDSKRLTALEKAGAPILAITFKDLGTLTGGFMAKDCRIAKAPTMTRGKTPSDQEWMFRVISLSIAHDGPRISPI